MTLNGNEIDLPVSVIVPFRDKFRVRKLIRKTTITATCDVKQGKTWLTLEYDNRNPCIANDQCLKTNMNKQNVITFNLFNFRKMARTLKGSLHVVFPKTQFH